MNADHTQEFKDRAVELTLKGDRSVPLIAEELGIKPQTLYGWRRSYRKTAAAQPGAKLTLAEENAQLRKELRRVSEERDILKKAVGYFANPSGK